MRVRTLLMKPLPLVWRPAATCRRLAGPPALVCHRPVRAWPILAAVLASAMLAAASGQPGAGLSPEQQQLLHRVRDNVARDLDTLAGFTYTLERRSYDVNLLGKVSNGDVLTYEVGPSPFEPGRPWRRLVAVNGQRLSAERLRKDEQKAREEAESRRRARDRDPTSASALKARDDREQAERARERLADVERVFRFSAMGGREVDGRPAVGFDMTPRPDARPQSDMGKQFDRLRGQLWVDPEQAQLLRAEFEATEDLTYGYGVIGRVSAGSKVLYRRTRVADGRWVPAEARFQGSGRTLLLIPFTLETWAKYADFRPPATVPPPGQAGPPPR